MFSINSIGFVAANWYDGNLHTTETSHPNAMQTMCILSLHKNSPVKEMGSLQRVVAKRQVKSDRIGVQVFDYRIRRTTATCASSCYLNKQQNIITAAYSPANQIEMGWTGVVVEHNVLSARMCILLDLWHAKILGICFWRKHRKELWRKLLNYMLC